MALVGVYVGLSKPLLTLFPIFLLTWLRYGIAAIPMLGWFKKQPGEAPLSKYNMSLLALASLIGSFLFTLSMLSGVKLTSALSAGIIMAGIPAAVALLSRIFLKERISKRTLAAIACAVAGIGLLAIANITTQSEISASPTTHTATRQTLLGHALLIIATFCEASYVVIGKKLSGQVSSKRISAYLNLWGLIFSTPMGIYLITKFDFAAIYWQQWGLLIFYALCASIITVWLWMTGLKTVPASSAGIFTAMLPISATLVGVAMGEHFSGIHTAALLLAISGIILATWPLNRNAVN